MKFIILGIQLQVVKLFICLRANQKRILLQVSSLMHTAGGTVTVTVTDPNARATQPGNRNAGVQVTSIKFNIVTVGALPRLTELDVTDTVTQAEHRHRRRRVAESRPHQFGLRDDSVVTARLTNRVAAGTRADGPDGPGRRNLNMSDRCL